MKFSYDKNALVLFLAGDSRDERDLQDQGMNITEATESSQQQSVTSTERKDENVSVIHILHKIFELNASISSGCTSMTLVLSFTLNIIDPNYFPSFTFESMFATLSSLQQNQAQSAVHMERFACENGDGSRASVHSALTSPSGLSIVSKQAYTVIHHQTCL